MIVDIFYIYTGNLDEYFTKFIPSKFSIFSLFDFLQCCCPNVQSEGNIYTHLNNCYNHFFMPCSYKIVVSVL